MLQGRGTYAGLSLRPVLNLGAGGPLVAGFRDDRLEDLVPYFDRPRAGDDLLSLHRTRQTRRTCRDVLGKSDDGEESRNWVVRSCLRTIDRRYVPGVFRARGSVSEDAQYVDFSVNVKALFAGSVVLHQRVVMPYVHSEADGLQMNPGGSGIFVGSYVCLQLYSNGREPDDRVAPLLRVFGVRTMDDFFTSVGGRITLKASISLAPDTGLPGLVLQLGQEVVVSSLADYVAHEQLQRVAKEWFLGSQSVVI